MLVLNLAPACSYVLIFTPLHPYGRAEGVRTTGTSMPKLAIVWHNHWKLILGVAALAAGTVLALNPEFVVPLKYQFAEERVPEVGSVVGLPGAPTELPADIPALPEAAAAAATALPTDRLPSGVTVRVAGSLSIPSIAVTAPLVYVSKVDEAAFQLGLLQGVVQYPGTARSGQLGNMYVFGHSSDYRWSKGLYKRVFAKLPEVKVGSQIVLTDGANRGYAYRVTGTAIVRVNEVKYLSQQNYQKRLLTVQTSYPVGTALKRFLVFAEYVPGKQ